MFDTYVVRPQPPSVNVRVEQKPHDAADAARLYGECEVKARQAVADAVVRELGANNEVRVVIAQRERSVADQDERIRVIFTLNNQRYDFKSTVDGLSRDVAREIGLEILRQVERLTVRR